MRDDGNQRSDREWIAACREGDGNALEQMCLRHDPLVKYVAKKYMGRGHEWDDLYQIGRLGLLKAIRNFDLRFDVRFSTYAVPIVMGEIRRYLRDDASVHVSRTVRENGARIQALMQEAGENIPVSEIAERLHMKCEDVVLALEAARPVRSLEEPVSADGDLLLMDTLGRDEQEDWLTRMEIKRLLSTLSGSDRSLIVKRYFNEETQTKIAAKRGMTQVQVSRLESRILKRLRECAGAEVRNSK